MISEVPWVSSVLWDRVSKGPAFQGSGQPNLCASPLAIPSTSTCHPRGWKKSCIPGRPS